MKTYTALKPLTLVNGYYARGAAVRLSDKQAEFLQRGGFVALADAQDTSAPQGADEDKGAPAAGTKKKAAQA